MKSITLTVTLAVALILLIGGGAYYALVLAPPSDGYDNVTTDAGNSTEGPRARATPRAKTERAGFLCEADPAQRERSRESCASSPGQCAARIQAVVAGQLAAGDRIIAAVPIEGKDGEPIWRLTASRQSSEKILYEYHPCDGKLHAR